jgi:hypothetical protein
MAENDDAPVFEPYSVRRRNQERQGQPVVFQHDDLPDQFLVQVFQILERAVGIGYPEIDESPSLYRPEVGWSRIYEDVAHEAGILDLAPTESGSKDKFRKYLLEAEITIEAILDAIELSFRAVMSLEGITSYEYGGVRNRFHISLPGDKAVRQLNFRFRQHGIGFQFIGGQLIRSDDEFLFVEVVEPAIALLHAEGFSAAHDEFMRAHQHYRRGEMQDALVDTNNALESTLKTVCERSGIPLTGRETASGLIAKVTENLIPSHMQTFLQALPNLMIAVSTLRNRPGIGHGAGSSETDVSDHITGYAINMTAATILFVVEAWKDRKENT